MMRIRHCGTALAGALLLALAACAADADRTVAPPEAAGPGPQHPESGPTNDPALLAAADTVEALGRDSFAECYAGIVLDHGQRIMTVYQKSGCGLEGAVRRRVSEIGLVFRNAEMSRTEMLALAQRIMDDAGYWAARGITVNGAGPQEDGSGVRVMTDEGGTEESARLSRHYGRPVLAVRGAAVAGPASPYQPPSPPATPSRR